jgi:hypothetical protein
MEYLHNKETIALGLLLALALCVNIDSIKELFSIFVMGIIFYNVYKNDLEIRERVIRQLNETLKEQADNITKIIRKEFEQVSAYNCGSSIDDPNYPVDYLQNSNCDNEGNSQFQYKPEIVQNVLESGKIPVVVQDRNDDQYDIIDETPTKPCPCGRWCHGTPNSHDSKFHDE